MPLFIQRRTGCCPAATYRALLLGSLVAIVAIVPLGLHPGLQTAQAQEYPGRPIRIIAPSTPGGGFDLVARVLGNQLSQQMGQQIVVENRPGGGTLLGTQTIARAPADGYHLLVGGLSNFALNMGLYKQPGYDPVADFVPLRIVVSHSYTLIARKDLAQSTLKDVFAFARANPGKLTIGSSGPGSGQYILAMFVRSLGNVDILMVPYKGAQPVYQDLLAGRVDLFFDNSTTTRSYLQSGQAKALAVSSRQRAPDAPQVPTINETGAFQLEMETWFGWFAPAKTPPAVVERLRAELDKATQLAEIRTRLEQNAGRSLRMSSAESEAFVKAEVSKWTGLMKQAGIVPE
jgi:tripartite-type tricarboxylate transporter receptor subunit TctC